MEKLKMNEKYQEIEECDTSNLIMTYTSIEELTWSDIIELDITDLESLLKDYKIKVRKKIKYFDLLIKTKKEMIKGK